MEDKVNYGDYIQLDDRFESVHIWSEDIERRIAGRWHPIKISTEKYNFEMNMTWNQKKEKYADK